jgi:hypothetical protein
MQTSANIASLHAAYNASSWAVACNVPYDVNLHKCDVRHPRCRISHDVYNQQRNWGCSGSDKQHAGRSAERDAIRLAPAGRFSLGPIICTSNEPVPLCLPVGHSQRGCSAHCGCPHDQSSPFAARLKMNSCGRRLFVHVSNSRVQKGQCCRREVLHFLEIRESVDILFETFICSFV